MSDTPSVLRGLPIGSDTDLLSVRPLLGGLLHIPEADASDRSQAFQGILSAVHRRLYVESISLLLHDGSQEQLVLSAATGLPGSSLPPEKYPSGQSLSGLALEQPFITVANDLATNPDATRRWVTWWSRHLQSRSLSHGAFVPIVGDFELRCILRFFNRLMPNSRLSPSGFINKDPDVLQVLSEFATVQLNKLWLSDRLSVLNESIESLLGQTTTANVADQVAKTGVRLANATAAAVFLPDLLKPDILRLRGTFGFRQDFTDELTVPLDRSLLGKAARSGSAVVVKDIVGSRDAFPQGPGRREGLASLVAVPLSIPLRKTAPHSQTTNDSLSPGVLVVYSKLPRKFHSSTCNLLQQFALAAGGVLDSRRRAGETEGLRQTLAFAAHSVRSPMQRIGLGLSTLKKSGVGDTALIAKLLDELDLANARLGTMLYSRKGLIEITGLNVTRLDIGSIIHRCVRRYRPIATAEDRNISLHEQEGVRQLPHIQGDAAKLDLVFDNLLENAIKYSWTNETVVIGSDIVGSSIRVWISDRGLGVPEDIRTRIFDVFARSDILDRRRHIKGTGLGLYVVRLIVEAHAGTVSVKSVPFLDDPQRRLAYEGYETTFTVTLPIGR